MKKATRQQTKEHNRTLVLKTIFEHDSISRADIARVTSLTPTTVSDIVADFMDLGLVNEIGVGESIGGKSPILLGLEEDSRWLIGLDLAQNQFRGAIVNLRGRVQKMLTLPVNDRNGEDALALVYEILDQLISEAHRPLLGIGVGTPGLVNTQEGVVITAVNLDWRDLPLANLLKDRYGLPVYVLNDSQAAAMGEYTYGNDHQKDNNLVVINARHGIGMGLLINGSLFQGDGGSAGEIGHQVVVLENGLPCRCGNHGCLETVASASAIMRKARWMSGVYPNTQLQRSSQAINLETIEQAFSNADPLACELVFEAAHFMGVAISGLVGVLNISKVVLTGDMICFGQQWLEKINQTVSQMSLPRQAQETHIELGQLGKDGVLLGASALLASNYSLLFEKQTQHISNKSPNFRG